MFHPLAVLAPMALAAAPAADPARTVTVSFGSEASGIDRGAFQALETLAGGSRLVAEHRVTPWGKEGERTLTLVAPDAAAAKALWAEVLERLPAEAERGYIDASGPGGVKHHVDN